MAKNDFVSEVNMDLLDSLIRQKLDRYSASLIQLFDNKRVKDSFNWIEGQIAAIPEYISEGVNQWGRLDNAIKATLSSANIAKFAAIGGKRKPGCFLFCLPADASTCCKAWVCAA